MGCMAENPSDKMGLGIPFLFFYIGSMPEWKILGGGSIPLVTVRALSSNPRKNSSCSGSKPDSLPNGSLGTFRERAATRV